MKQSNLLLGASKGINRWLKAGSKTLPALGAAVLFGLATPATADTRVGFQVTPVGAQHAHHKVERKLNRVARKVTRELNALHPVGYRDRHERRDHRDRYDRRFDRRDHRYDRRDRRYDRRYNRWNHRADPYFRDPLYRPLSYKRWSRYQWRLTGSERYISPRGYQRYLKKYRKHYRHGLQDRYFAGIDRRDRERSRNRR